MKSRNITLDILRCFAVMLVIFFHFNFQTAHIPFWNDIILEGGQLGVNIFFIISGILISYPFLKQNKENGTLYSIKKYTIKRLLRIIPLFWISSVFLFLIRNHIHNYYEGNYQFTWKEVIQNLFFISDNFRVLNPVIWTLRIEMLFYILFPLLFFLVKRWQPFFVKWVHVFFGLVFILMYRIVAGSHQSLREDVFSNLEGFFYGTLISTLLLQDTHHQKFHTPYPIAVSLILLCLLLIINQTIAAESVSFQPFFRSGCNACLFFLFLGLLRKKIAAGNIITRKLLACISYISLISYSLYLVHFNVFYDIAMPLFGGANGLNGLKLLLSRICAVSITFALASITYFLIERPFVNIYKKQVAKANVGNKPAFQNL